MKRIIILISIILIALIFLGIANYCLINIKSKRTPHHLSLVVNDKCKEGEDFCTHLPIIVIDTMGEEIPEILNSEDARIKISAQFEIINNHDLVNRLDDKPEVKETILIGHRGNSSLDFDKHQYSISIINEKFNSKDVSLLGMQKENSWILNGPFLDKTQIRNYLAYNIIGNIMPKTSDVKFCEVFLNGEYQGLYIMIEKISRTLTQLTKYKPRWSGGLTSYLIRQDRFNPWEQTINNFTRYTNKINKENGFNVIYPSNAKINDSLLKYIDDDFSEFEKMLYSYDYKDYKKYIDVDSFVDYLIVNEYFRNSDAGTHSTYLHKDVRGKITMGPVWDFNNAINNYVEEEYAINGFVFQDKPYYVMLLKDQEFVEKVITRYKKLRKTYLNNDYVQNFIVETLAFIEPAVERNFEIWGYTFDKNIESNFLRPAERNYDSYEDAVDQIQWYLEKRGNWLDNNIELLYQYSHPSVNKVYNME